MFRKLTCAAVFAACALAVCAQDLTLDQIIAKNIQARGGLEKLKSVNTMRVTSKLSLPNGMEVTTVSEVKRPNSTRSETTLQGMTAVSAFDGKNGWAIMPFQGKKDPEPVPEARLKDMVEQASFDGILVDYKEKGAKLELAGKESVEGSPAYKLKVTFPSGNTRVIYLDADSFLEVKTEAKTNVNGTDMESEAFIGDYKNVDGLMIPHSTSGGVKGSAQKMTSTVQKVEINVPIDDARFKMPEIKKPEEPKAEPKKPGA